MANCRFNIDFRDIPSIPQMLKDYLNGDLESLQGLSFSKANALKQAATKAECFPTHNREVLVQVLSEQMSATNISGKQMQNLELLKKDNTLTVTTGHQLNLFTGPVFFIYKIMQTIKTAEYLNENNDSYNFVPVFWMATEDHDFDEINHFKTPNNFYVSNEKQGDAVGRIVITDNSFIEDFEKEFKDSVYGTELVRWAKEAYVIGNTFAAATRTLVNRIFAEYGLLIIDGDDGRLKKLVAPTFEAELLHETLFTETKSTVEELLRTYGKVQVNPREINLFYLNNQSRNRIEKIGDDYHIVDTDLKFTQEELLTQLKDFPERFSPNAVLRPAYQETILPNIIYIGGNAEVMYWLELKKFFEKAKIDFPILVPRNSFVFLTEKILGKIQKLDFCVEDFFGNFQEKVHEKLLAHTELQPLLLRQEKEVTSLFEELKNRAKETDKTFENLVDAEKTRQLKSFEKMKKRLLRAEKIVQADLYQRCNKLYEEVNPGGTWQERKLNFSGFYADEGKLWLDKVYDNTNVNKSELIVLVL